MNNKFNFIFYKKYKLNFLFLIKNYNLYLK